MREAAGQVGEKRIGLIGGMSWESTRNYYSLLNTEYAKSAQPWAQPKIILDSLDFREIVELQRGSEWAATGRILADSAMRLEKAGATVIGITANTMHINFDAVQNAVSVPVIDIRKAIAEEMKRLGLTNIGLLGTKYVVEEDFYSSKIEESDVVVTKPTPSQILDLQSMIYDELTLGIVSDSSRQTFFDIAQDCMSRGADVIGLCCTEFGMFFEGQSVNFPFIDSTLAHVKALLA